MMQQPQNLTEKGKEARRHTCNNDFSEQTTKGVTTRTTVAALWLSGVGVWRQAWWLRGEALDSAKTRLVRKRGAVRTTPSTTSNADGCWKSEWGCLRIFDFTLYEPERTPIRSPIDSTGRSVRFSEP
ncbi:hypothetical protein PIB30_063351 [Stylosanthes scabra]|uniref:Uncharacterized protein n=1 Tax=Stylosanthes scabra TaxID=79078 RepID=A0ABU6ZK53_9FABA|nr:hypothetical protein [Stylosanthes scabra]